MNGDRVVDGVLEHWGDKLFRRRRGGEADEPSGPGGRRRSGASGGRSMSAKQVRAGVRSVIRSSSQQVVVKITGGGKGFKAMVAHLRYISRQGKEVAGGRGRTLEVVDELGQRHEGVGQARRLMEEWRTSGSYIPEQSHRKEAFHVIFSMPRETRPQALQEAVSSTARRLFEGHRYAMVMHLDQGAPHVHVMVRAERRDGHRLNPRKADLDRWRTTFAVELQARGIDAVATRRATRLQGRLPAPLWEVKAREVGRLRRDRTVEASGPAAIRSRAEALQAWRAVTGALAGSMSESDRLLALEAVGFLARQMRGGRRAWEVARGRGGREVGRADA